MVFWQSAVGESDELIYMMAFEDMNDMQRKRATFQQRANILHTRQSLHQIGDRADGRALEHPLRAILEFFLELDRRSWMRGMPFGMLDLGCEGEVGELTSAQPSPSRMASLALA